MNQGQQPDPQKGLNGKPQLLLTTALTLSKVLLVVVVVLIMALSLVAGASLTRTAMRAGVGAVVLGLLVWLMNWYLERISLEQVRDNWTHVVRQRQQGSTGEWKA